MTKDMIAKSVSEYFVKEGGILNIVEYKAKGKDVPVKDYIIRKHFGSWNRFVSVINKRYPVNIPEVKKAPAKKAPAKKVEKKDVK
jgi:hypothetical protein